MREYLLENRYSHLQDLRVVLRPHSGYDVETPDTDFEARVQRDLAEARQAHQREELGIALHGYESLRALILKTVNPTLPLGSIHFPTWNPPMQTAVLDTLMENAVNTLVKTRKPTPALPLAAVPADVKDGRLAKQLGPFVSAGVGAGKVDAVAGHLERAADLVESGEPERARMSLELALKATPATEPRMRAAVLHDLALLDERAAQPDAALKRMEQAGALFQEAKSADGELAVARASAGIFTRQGRAEDAARMTAKAAELARTHGLHDIKVDRVRQFAGLEAGETNGHRGLALAEALGTVEAEPAHMISLAFAAPTQAAKVFTLPIKDAVSVSLATLDKDTLKPLYEQMAKTKLLDHIYVQALPAPALVAYLPYIYFFVLPMSIGDCYESMGNHAAAEQQYRSTLAYPYMNENVEATKVWTRLAECYLAWGDDLYRDARDDSSLFAPAKSKYELIIKTDGSIPASSPLYSHARFAGLKTRAQAIAAAASPVDLDENPALGMPLLSARARLGQLAAGLNFFGLAAGYVPPFSFEYLQNTARYFAQHAATLEQSYIQFKSQAENEEFRREQMDQQAELSRASVELEQLGLAEAQAGRKVAQASKTYADVQHNNAQQSQSDFASARWELLELAGLEAWSGAAAQDQDDEVRQTISGYSYYNVDGKRRSLVVQDLALQRTAITHDLEAARLAREVAAAAAYANVAAAQVAQANARIAVAEQRIEVARLQQRFAEENRDFLDMKEFSARMWYELARAMRGLSQRYLDMAIEIAVLMERAYNLETGRDLHKIQFDYRNAALGDLLGADTLLRDVDFFTFDHVTTTRTKKAPIKVALSLADEFPMSFDQLQRTGQAFFETRFEHFDRAYPGLWLQKLQNVELLLVGLTGSGQVRGTLRNIGVSTFRDRDGTTRQQVYPADVMPLSEYEVRQDALVFRQDTDTLRLFENNGIATMWRLDLPLDANDYDPATLLDARLVLSFDAFFDEELEAAVLAALPAGGHASRAASMRLFAPDELFYLRSQGEGVLPFAASDFPYFQRDLVRTAVTLRATGTGTLTNGLVVRLTVGGSEIAVTLGADGTLGDTAPGSPLAALVGDPVPGDWTIAVRADDNPGKADGEGNLDLEGLQDVQVFQEYDFDYR